MFLELVLLGIMILMGFGLYDLDCGMNDWFLTNCLDSATNKLRQLQQQGRVRVQHPGRAQLLQEIENELKVLYVEWGKVEYQVTSLRKARSLYAKVVALELQPEH